jgi:hypothetical protein
MPPSRKKPDVVTICSDPRYTLRSSVPSIRLASKIQATLLIRSSYIRAVLSSTYYSYVHAILLTPNTLQASLFFNSTCSDSRGALLRTLLAVGPGYGMILSRRRVIHRSSRPIDLLISPAMQQTPPLTRIPPLVPNFDLHRACAAGNLGLVQYAITQGQPVNSVLAGVLPLHAAASGGNEQVVKTLILAGADVNAPRLSSKIGPPQDVGGIATVVGPSHKGRLGSANSASGQSATYRPGSSSSGRGVPSASAPTMGKRGSTPLHFAAAMGHPNIVKILLDCGADPNARDCHKMRPIDAARAAGQSRTVRLLEEFEAPRSAQASPSPRYPVTPVTRPISPRMRLVRLPHCLASPCQHTLTAARHPWDVIRHLSGDLLSLRFTNPLLQLQSPP